MAKIAQLSQNSEQIYPKTITDAIGVVGKAKLLTTYLSNLEAALGQNESYVANSSATYISGATSMNDADVILDTELKKVADQVAANTIVANDKSVIVAPITSGADSGKTGINVNIKSGEKVLTLDANNGLYTNIRLSGITPSSEVVKEEYALIATDGSQLGTSVKIYKDSHIVSITYITDPADEHYQNLEYVYIDASGATQTSYVDISQLVLEAEFGDGLQVDNHVVSVKKDSESENFLTISSNGVKISGVQDAIDASIDALNANVSGESNSVKVEVTQASGEVTNVTVTTTDATVTFNDSTSAITISGNNSDIVTKTGADAIKSYIDAKVAGKNVTAESKSTDYITAEAADNKVTVSAVTGTFTATASALTATKGIADASEAATAVKTYVDGRVLAEKERVDALTDNKNDGDYINVKVTTLGGNVSNVEVDESNILTTSGAVESVSTTGKLVDAKAIKDYVDGEITKSDIKVSADITPSKGNDGTSLAINYGSIASGATSAVTGGAIYLWGVTATVGATADDSQAWPAQNNG